MSNSMLPVSCFRLFLVIIFHCLRRVGEEPKSLPASFLIEMRCLSIARELMDEGEGEGAGHSDWGMCQHLFLLSDLGKTFYPALLLLSHFVSAHGLLSANVSFGIRAWHYG